MEYEKTTDGSHQFRVPSVDGNTLAMRVTSEGIIIDLEDSTGEVIQSAYQFWSDLEDMTHGGEMEPNPYTLCPDCGETHHEDEPHECGGMTPEILTVDKDGDVIRKAVHPEGDTFTLEELQALVGGYVEAVHMRENKDGSRLLMLVDEDGRRKGLTFNIVASTLCRRPIIGNALILNSTLID